MILHKTFFALIIATGISGCDSNPSNTHSHNKNTKVASDCKKEVDHAIAHAGSDPKAMMRAGEKALDDCMTQ